MTRQAPFRGADVCLLTGLARHPTKKPQDMVREMLTYIEYTIKKGGSVLLPTYSAGVVHDLLELVVGHLSQTAIRDTSVYFVSPSAKHSLQFANICAHWLCPSKAERVNLPEWPVTTLPPSPPFVFWSTLEDTLMLLQLPLSSMGRDGGSTHQCLLEITFCCDPISQFLLTCSIPMTSLHSS